MQDRKRNVLIGCSAVLVLIIHFSVFAAMERFQSRKPDFASLYQAGRVLVHTQFPEIVRHFPSLNGSEYTVETASGPYPADSLHPPFEMIIYASLSLLKFRFAYPVWWVCNLIFFYCTAFLLWQHLPRLQDHYPYLLLVIATFFPVLVAFVQGQSTILLLFLLTLSFHLSVKQKDFRAGVALSMGMFKFVIVIPILFWVVLERRWKSLAGFAAGSVALFLEATCLVGLKGIFRYATLVAGLGKAPPEAAGTEVVMPNLRGLIHAIGSSVATGSVLMVFTLALSVGLLFWVDLRLSKRASMNVRFSIQVLLATLVSYHLYPHDAALLVLPLALLVNEALRVGAKTPFGVIVVLSSICIYLTPFVTPLQIGMPILCCASLVLLGSCLRYSRGSAARSLAISQS